MRLCLVEDSGAARLEPLTLSRPVYDLLLGGSTIQHKLIRALGFDSALDQFGVVIRSHLAELERERNPHIAVNDRGWLTQRPVVVASARWIPPDRLELPGHEPTWIGLCEGRPACAFVAPEEAADLEPTGVDGWFERLASRATSYELGGEWIAYPWDLVNKNTDHVVRDFHIRGGGNVDASRLATLALVGPADRLYIHESARIDPYTVFDTTNGPITISAGAIVQPFTRVEGPSFIGRDTQLFRANLRGGVTIGPNCRIGGEVEASVVLGRSNKYHEGFLGHAYVGEWVNLGGITSNSDLRNDYGEVMVPLGGDPVATGQAKIGCFLGDHTRTGLGSMINTGTVVGVMCNLLPAGPLLPKHVPSFAAVRYGRVAPGFPLEEMFATARIVKSRRGEVFTPVEEQLYLDLYEQTRLERERAFQKARDRRFDNPQSSALGF